MAKTLSAATKTHIAQDVTSLTTCWRITREDGTVFRFTNHDEDIVFATTFSLTVSITAGERYIATGGFSRTNIDIKDGLRVDNLDLIGLLSDSSAGIQVTDLQSGKLNNALIEIFMVNWEAPDDGVIPLQKGNLGEVTLDIEKAVYEAESRGLSQRFSRKIGSIYGPPCRVDLFSTECGLAAALFTDTVQVESTTDNRTFVVPAFQTLIDPEPGLSTGLRVRAVEQPSGTLRLARGPAELGTPDRPFLVANSTDLTNIRNNVVAWYALTADIDMSGFGLFTPIPTFRGGLDGRGFEILDLDLDHNAVPRTAGLFDRLEQGCVVRRLGFRRATVRTGNSTDFGAPLAAQSNSSDLANNFGGVEDCYAVDCDITTDGDRVGGLIGFARDLDFIKRCFTSNRVTGAIGARVGTVVGEVITSGLTQADLFSDDDRAGVAQDGTGETVTRLTTPNAQLDATFPNFDKLFTWSPPSNQTSAIYVDTGGETLTFADANPDTITRSAGSWITDGFARGDRILIAGTASNNGTFDVDTVSATVLTLQLVEVLAAETPAGAGVTITFSKYPRLKIQRIP